MAALASFFPQNGHGEKQTAPARTRRPDVVCLNDVKSEAITWLWEPYIPRGMITLLSGDPGVGKTTLALAFAARLTRGERLEDGASCEPGNVLYLTQENSASHVLRPRFDALGGDPKRFFLLRGTIEADNKPGSICLSDTEQLEQAILHHQAIVMVIDPLQSYLGAKVDAHRANETRPVMDGLIRVAEATGCAFVITRHLSKAVGGSAMHRGLGSIDISGAARSELLVARDPDDPSRIVMAQSKSNLGRFGPSLAFSIEQRGVVRWRGESPHAANDLVNGVSTEGRKKARQTAQEFLRTQLAGGPVLSSEIDERAKELGITTATLRRAKEDLGVIKKPGGFGGKWTLELPTVAQKPSELLNAVEGATVEKVSNSGEGEAAPDCTDD